MSAPITQHPPLQPRQDPRNLLVPPNRPLPLTGYPRYQPSRPSDLSGIRVPGTDYPLTPIVDTTQTPGIGFQDNMFERSLQSLLRDGNAGRGANHAKHNDQTEKKRKHSKDKKQDKKKKKKHKTSSEVIVLSDSSSSASSSSSSSSSSAVDDDSSFDFESSSESGDESEQRRNRKARKAHEYFKKWNQRKLEKYEAKQAVKEARHYRRADISHPPGYELDLSQSFSGADLSTSAISTPNHSNMVRLTKTTDIRQVKRATYDELERLREDLEAVERQGVYTTNFYAHMSKAVLDAVDHEVKQLYVERNEPRSYKKNCWWSWPAHEFFHVMNNRFRLTTQEKSVTQDFLDECKKLVFEYRADSSGESEYIVNMNDIAMKTKVLTSLEAEKEDTFTVSQRKALFRTLTQNIRKRGKGALNIRKYIVDKLNSMMTGDKDTWTISKFLDELRSLTAKARRVFGEILDYTTSTEDSLDEDGDRDPGVSKRTKKRKSSKRNDESPDKAKRQKKGDKSTNRDKKVTSYKERCSRCNSNRHASKDCTFKEHADYNAKGAWSESEIGQAYLLLDPKSPYLISGRQLTKDMSKLVYPSTKTPPEETPAKSSKGKKPVKKGNILTCCPDCSSDSTTVEDKPLDDVLVPVTLLHRFAKDRSVTAIAQLDTAASSKKKESTEEINAISRDVVRRIIEVGGVPYESPARLCGFGSTCKTYKQAIDLNVSLLFNPSANDTVEMGTITF